ncbi:MAG: transglutaminase-like domain-containing protein [Syntrophales bacterium]|nr:transglutaminase-like domain-containing protein [Syntrophales bacterium]
MNGRLRWHHIAGGLCITFFLFLLLIKLNYIVAEDTPSPLSNPVSKTGKIHEDESWMSIYREGQKVGYCHRVFTRENGGYRVSEAIFLRINAMGTVQAVKLSTKGRLNRDFTLSSFEMELQSNFSSYEARGRIQGRRLILEAGPKGMSRRYDLILKEKPYMSTGLREVLLQGNLEEGKIISIPIFDPATLGTVTVKITKVGKGRIKMRDRYMDLTKISIDFKGATQLAWIDDHGRIMREEGAMGFVLERTTKEEALASIIEDNTGSTDIVFSASVLPNLPIPNHKNISILKIELIIPYAERFALHGGRQIWDGKTLTIVKENLPVDGSESGDLGNPEFFLKPSPFIQSDHPEITDAVNKILGKEKDDMVKARKIVSWVHKNIEKCPVFALSNALETLNRRMGDCTEHAVLVAAFGRAAGIPTAVETGLVYQEGRFYFHAWNAFYIKNLKKWITADAVMDQIPADVTHIRFIRGDLENQIDLISLIGQIHIRILEMK